MRPFTLGVALLTLALVACQEPVEKSEQVPVYTEEPTMSHRSFAGNPNIETDNTISPWCSVAVFCHRTEQPVCGYDDNFGYGKFVDICHMLQVNCYWKHNFALVSCKPVL